MNFFLSLRGCFRVGSAVLSGSVYTLPKDARKLTNFDLGKSDSLVN